MNRIDRIAFIIEKRYPTTDALRRFANIVNDSTYAKIAKALIVMDASGEFDETKHPRGKGGRFVKGGGGASAKSEESSKKDIDINKEKNYNNSGSEKVDKEYAKKQASSLPDTVSDRCREIYMKAAKNEPQITADLKSLLPSMNGAEMSGLEFRLKEGGSFARKISKDAKQNGTTPEEEAEGLFDIVRYTQTSSVDNMVSNAKKTLTALEKKGYKVNKVKNTWGFDGAYKGVNCKVMSPGGQQFELQFHTPESLEIKEINHTMYEEQRLLDPYNGTPEERKRYEQLDREMMENARKLTPPVGIETLKWGK